MRRRVERSGLRADPGTTTASYPAICGRAVVLLAAALLPALAACSSTPAPGGTGAPGGSNAAAASPSPAPQWKPQTAWEAAVVDIQEDGTYSKDAALRLFATAYGPLPGVDVEQDLRGVEDRTLAITAVARVRDELTDEQRAAIDAYLAPPDDAIRIEIPPVAAMDPWRLVKADPGLEDAIRAVGELARMDIAAKIGDFDGTINVHFKPRPEDVQPIEGVYPNGGTVAAYQGGLFSGCNITIYDEATAQSGLQLTALITHEVMHCFQGAAHGDVATHNNAPAWINEGMATWVGMDLGGPSPNYQRFWDLYLSMPQVPLTSRAYDAVGFYAHLQDAGIDPWTVIRPILAAGTNSLDAYRSAGADSEAFVDTWASSVLRDGGAWDTDGPGITATAYKPGVGIIGNGADVGISQPFFTNDITRYVLGADMIELEIDGHARLRAGGLDIALHGSSRYCVSGLGCSKVCPGQEPPPNDGTIPNSIHLATSGGSEGLVGHIRGIKLEEPQCSKPPSAEPTDGEFCRRYRDYVDWAMSLGPDAEITQQIAAEIARRFDEMYPVAPPEMYEWVALVWQIYATFANIPEPINIPVTGQVGGIDQLPRALQEMHGYCGIPWPGP